VSNQILCVHEGHDRVAALLHWGDWLPIQTDPEISAFLPLPAGRHVVQVTHLKGANHVGLMYRLWAEILHYADRLKATDLICAVPPSRVALYKRLGFEVVTQGEWSLARNHAGERLPVVVLRLRMDIPACREMALRPTRDLRVRVK
jgi:hypothetical protein